MAKKIKLHPRFAFNDEKRKVGALLPIIEFNELIEVVEDLQDVLDVWHIKAQNQKYYPLEEVMAEVLGEKR